jgi:hypothetical protein
MIKEEKAVGGGHRTAHFRNCRFATGSVAGFSARPVKLCFADLSSSGLYAARLVIILLDKILSTIESNC